MKQDTAGSRQMILSGFCSGSGSYHQGGWRHPGANPNYASDFSLWVDYARKLEAAKFHMMFVADIISPPGIDNPENFARASTADRFEPLTLLAALAPHTKQLGLTGTATTSYCNPYDVARQFASLDLISGGRAGWNIVTGITPEDASQYGGGAYLEASERYARGEEFVDVVMKLWASVEPGAFVRDQKSGLYSDVTRIREIHHRGRYYQIRGPLNIGPSQQGRPLLVQAGQSEEGRALASRVAEVIFTAQNDLALAKAFYEDIRGRAAAWGRDPNHVKVLPGCMIIVGDSRAEADEKADFLDSLIDLGAAQRRLQTALKFMDLSQYKLDDPFSELPPSAVVSRGANHALAARKEGLTLRQVLVRSATSNAHLVAKGTPADVVDQMNAWFGGDACDGFNLLTAAMPTSMDDVLEKVIPELRRRNLFRSEFQGATLRENLGVPLAPIPPLVDTVTSGGAEVARG